MNPDKTEAMFVGTAERQQTEGDTGSIDLGGVSSTTSHSVRSLGVIIDDTLSFDEQVNSVCNLRALRHIRKVISEDTAKTIACSMIDGRLDYCNGLLYGTSAANIHEVQRVLNYGPCSH